MLSEVLVKEFFVKEELDVMDVFIQIRKELEKSDLKKFEAICELTYPWKSDKLQVYPIHDSLQTSLYFFLASTLPTNGPKT